MNEQQINEIKRQFAEWHKPEIPEKVRQNIEFTQTAFGDWIKFRRIVYGVVTGVDGKYKFGQGHPKSWPENKA